MSDKFFSRIFIRNLAIFMFVGVSPLVLCWSHQEEKDFRKMLFKNYDTTIRPLKDMRDVVEVRAKLAIDTVREFDIVNGYITVNAYLTLEWCDEFLSWNTSIHKISNMSVPKDVVWYPDIMLCNTESKANIQNLPKVFLNNNGCIEKNIPLYFKSSCEVDAYGFPFDEHRCTISLCFTDYDTSKVEMKYMNCSTTEDLSENNWIIVKSCSVKNNFYGEGILDFNLSRKIQANSLSNLLPPIIFLLLNMMVGQLSVESGEKVSFATTVFLANIVYLGDINKKLPKEPTIVPLMFWCHLLLTCLSGISVIISIVASKRFFKMRLPTPISLNKVGTENLEIKHGSNKEDRNAEAEIPENSICLKNKFSVTNWFCCQNFEFLMFNIMCFVSVIFGTVFLSLFSQSITGRN